MKLANKAQTEHATAITKGTHTHSICTKMHAQKQQTNRKKMMHLRELQNKQTTGSRMEKTTKAAMIGEKVIVYI